MGSALCAGMSFLVRPLYWCGCAERINRGMLLGTVNCEQQVLWKAIGRIRQGLVNQWELNNEYEGYIRLRDTISCNTLPGTPYGAGRGGL
ncbi:hypothetical protein DL98DRAFT_255450 [Cadophora sp. DSE1049]|nr:hypothetical protein DL98DRAFT_255450 [Cadophora sp. DSE1049]